MDGGAQGRFGGTALADALQDALYVAHPIGIVDVGDGSQGFGVGDVGLRPGKLQEAAFENIEWNVVLLFEQPRELVSLAAEAPGLNNIAQCLRAAKADSARQRAVR